MWPKEYKDYKTDEPNIKNPIQPGHGIIGCEMHELNGWGNTLHHPRKKKKGFIGSLIAYFFGPKGKDAI